MLLIDFLNPYRKILLPLDTFLSFSLPLRDEVDSGQQQERFVRGEVFGCCCPAGAEGGEGLYVNQLLFFSDFKLIFFGLSIYKYRII